MYSWKPPFRLHTYVYVWDDVVDKDGHKFFVMPLLAEQGVSSSTPPLESVDRWQIRVPMTPTSGVNDLLGRLTELREPFMIVCQMITKDMIRDTDEQPGKTGAQREVQRAPRAGASVLVRSGCTAFLEPAVFANSETLNHALWGFLWQLHHVGVISDQLNLQPFSPPQRMEGGSENSTLLIVAWSFWWLTLDNTLEQKTPLIT